MIAGAAAFAASALCDDPERCASCALAARKACEAPIAPTRSGGSVGSADGRSFCAAFAPNARRRPAAVALGLGARVGPTAAAPAAWWRCGATEGMALGGVRAWLHAARTGTGVEAACEASCSASASSPDDKTNASPAPPVLLAALCSCPGACPASLSAGRAHGCSHDAFILTLSQKYHSLLSGSKMTSHPMGSEPTLVARRTAGRGFGVRRTRRRGAMLGVGLLLLLPRLTRFRHPRPIAPRRSTAGGRAPKKAGAATAT